jgi:hypothetical protein
MLQDRKRIFHHLLSMDRLFTVKFTYLLDRRVVQNFVDELGNFYKNEKPIRRARRRLKRYQINAIEKCHDRIRHKLHPAPCSSQVPSKESPLTAYNAKDRNQEGQKKEGSKGEHKHKTSAEPWWSNNPSVVASWRLPEGKTYSDFYNPREPEKKPNTLGWPKFPHHKFPSKSKKPCLKYQAKGSCSSACFMAHINPSKMETVAKKLFEEQFIQIYKPCHERQGGHPPRMPSALGERAAVELRGELSPARPP